jgi:hypothetical protein
VRTLLIRLWLSLLQELLMSSDFGSDPIVHFYAFVSQQFLFVVDSSFASAHCSSLSSPVRLLSQLCGGGGSGAVSFADYHGHGEVALIRDPFSHAFARERDPTYHEAQVHTKCVELEAWLLITRHEVFLLESKGGSVRLMLSSFARGLPAHFCACSETLKQRLYRERAVSTVLSDFPSLPADRAVTTCTSAQQRDADEKEEATSSGLTYTSTLAEPEADERGGRFSVICQVCACLLLADLASLRSLTPSCSFSRSAQAGRGESRRLGLPASVPAA